MINDKRKTIQLNRQKIQSVIFSACIVNIFSDTRIQNVQSMKQKYNVILKKIIFNLMNKKCK